MPRSGSRYGWLVPMNADPDPKHWSPISNYLLVQTVGAPVHCWSEHWGRWAGQCVCGPAHGRPAGSPLLPARQRRLGPAHHLRYRYRDKLEYGKVPNLTDPDPH